MWLAANTPILSINAETWQGTISIEHIELSILVTVLFVALIAAYEIVRDVRRLMRI